MRVSEMGFQRFFEANFIDRAFGGFKFNHFDDVLYICCVNNSSTTESSTGPFKDLMEISISGSKTMVVNECKKKQVPWQKNQSSPRICHIFSCFCYSRIFKLGVEPHIPIILVKLDLWNHHPDLIFVSFIYLKRRSHLSINRCTLTPATVPPGLSVEISHQTWSLSSFLSDEMHWKHWQPFLRLWGCCWSWSHCEVLSPMMILLIGKSHRNLGDFTSLVLEKVSRGSTSWSKKFTISMYSWQPGEILWTKVLLKKIKKNIWFLVRSASVRRTEDYIYIWNYIIYTLNIWI